MKSLPCKWRFVYMYPSDESLCPSFIWKSVPIIWKYIYTHHMKVCAHHSYVSLCPSYVSLCPSFIFPSQENLWPLYESQSASYESLWPSYVSLCIGYYSCHCQCPLFALFHQSETWRMAGINLSVLSTWSFLFNKQEIMFMSSGTHFSMLQAKL